MQVSDEMVNRADSVLSRVKAGIPDETIRLALAAAFAVAQTEAALSTDAEPVKTAPAVAVKALRPFAEKADRYNEIPGLIRFNDDVELWQVAKNRGMEIDITVGDLRRAREAYSALSAQVQDAADPVKAFARWLNNGPEIAKAAGNVIDVRVTTACGNKLRLTGGASPASKHGDAE